MKKWILFFATCNFMIGILGCQSKPKPRPSVIAEIPGASSDQTKSFSTEPLVKNGDNQDLFISSNGRFLLYGSGERNSHSRYQCYLLDLVSKIEKRLTWSDGDCYSPSFFEESSSILYSSSTDTIKELKDLSFQKPTTIGKEIYLSDIWGRKIKRLTKTSNIDLQPLKAWEQNSVFFLSEPVPTEPSVFQENSLRILQINNGKSTEVLKLPGFRLQKIQYSKSSNKWLWLQKNKDGQELWHTASRSFKDVKPLPESVYLATWTQDSDIVLVARNQKDVTEISSLNLNTNEEKSITTLQTKVLELVWNSQKNQLVFISGEPKQRKIFAIDLKTN